MNKIRKNIINHLYMITVAIFVVFIVCSLLAPDITNHPIAENNANITDNWYYRYYTDGKGWMQSSVSSFTTNNEPEKGTIYHMTSTLSDSISGNHSIVFQTRNCWVSVYLNGTLHYTNIPSQPVVNAEYLGISTHIVPIPSTVADQNIEIAFIPCTDNFCNFIDTIYGGDSTHLLLAIVINNLLPAFLSILIIFLGIHTFVCALSFKHTRSGQIMIYNGLFCSALGILNLCQLEIISLFLQHNAGFYEIKLITIALLPFFLLHYIASATDTLPTTPHRIIQTIPLICFGIILLSHVTRLIPIVRFLPLIYSEIAYTIFAALYYVIRCIVKQHNQKLLQKMPHILFLVFVLCYIAETCIYYIYAPQMHPYISCLVLIIHQWFSQHRHNSEIKHYAIIGQNAQHLQDAAYYDSLTQLMNRTALNRDMDELDKNLGANSSIAIIQMDLNFLKRTNDVLGHIAGDRLLKNAAHAIYVGFADYGKCYRFGGDEFVIILTDNPKEKYNFGISAMENECDRINKTLPPMEHVSIAYGIAYYVPDTDTSLWRVQERADIAMYERKRVMKQQMSSIKYTDDRL